MFGWLKDKLDASWQNSEIAKAAEQLQAQFGPLEKVQGAKPALAERLTRYVFTGEAEDAVAELAALQNTQFVLSNPASYIHTHVGSVDLPSLVKLLPEDPELYLRLADVYDATYQTGVGVTITVALGGVPIPAFQGSLSWVGAFLIEISRGGKQREPFFSTNLLTQMIVARGEDPNLLIRGPFFCEDAQGKPQLSRYLNPPFSYFQCLQGFDDLVLSSPDVVRPAFKQKDATSRANVLRALGALNIAPDSFAEEIASLAVSASKEVRETAEHIVLDRFALFRQLLEKHAEKGTSDERYHAVRLLGQAGDDSVRTFLAKRREVEKSQKVVEAIQQVLGNREAAMPAGAAHEEYDLPPIAVATHAPLDKQVLADLHSCIEECERKSAEEFARRNAQVHGKLTPFVTATADQLFDALQNFVVKENETWQVIRGSLWGNAYQVLVNFVTHPKLELIHLVRWCLLITGRRIDGAGYDSLGWSLIQLWGEPFISYQRSHNKQIDLRELAAVFRAIGIDDRIIGRQLIQANRFVNSPFSQANPNTIWPYFAERLDLIEEALGRSQPAERSNYPSYLHGELRQNAFGILKLFPQVPTRFVQPMWDVALGSGKTERPLAQDCLEKFPKREERIVAALSSRQQDARLAAAQWLSNLRYTAAIPQLRTALAKEKSEIVKDELIKTLETLGVKLEELFDLEKLDDEAQKGLKKGIPNELDWFPFDQLPTVRWADSGKQVSPGIIQWFILQGHRLKTAEAGPTLRRYCSLFQPDDREKLGMFVLESWIAKDTTPKHTSDQAANEAQRLARQMAIYAKQYPQYYPEFNEERVYQTNFNRLLVEPEGSQTATKGILAVAGACCSGNAAPIVHRYVKQWYGYRGAQAKALLQVLAWIDQPVATQVVLSVANRFRTKGIQEEAMRLCQMLAERKGWTLDELADRTIPTAGFDEDGRIELNYGSRSFAASLADDLSILLTNQDGKTISSLPEPNQSDDPDQARQSKAALSNARKELKTVVTMQKDRLYEAMCTQRTWSFEDWDTYLRKHPIVGRYCQRLIWTAYEDDKLIGSFRPLPDGSLTNHQDDEINMGQETSIRLGHDQTLAPDDRTAWLQHLSDYKVEPLFQQFGKQLFELPEAMKDATEISDFLGHLVKAFSLRNRLTRQGYTRGAAQDAGWFYDYKKTFLSLGLEAIIEFSGNGLPEENRTVALHKLYFTRKDVNVGSSWGQLTLGQLPRVLLAECWNDIRMAAAEGTGFAEDWEKQTEMQ